MNWTDNNSIITFISNFAVQDIVNDDQSAVVVSRYRPFSVFTAFQSAAHH